MEAERWLGVPELSVGAWARALFGSWHCCTQPLTAPTTLTRPPRQAEPSVQSSSPTKVHFAALSLQPNSEPCCHPAFASPLIPMQFHIADGKLPICVNTQPPGKTVSKVQLPGAKQGKAPGESGPDAKGLTTCGDINAPTIFCCPEMGIAALTDPAAISAPE